MTVPAGLDFGVDYNFAGVCCRLGNLLWQTVLICQYRFSA